MLSVLTSNRFKSFYWRTGMMIIAVIVAQLGSNLDLIAPYVNPATITVLGLILGEVSKYLNTKSA
jgi:hypothetical protein